MAAIGSIMTVTGRPQDIHSKKLTSSPTEALNIVIKARFVGLPMGVATPPMLPHKLYQLKVEWPGLDPYFC